LSQRCGTCIYFVEQPFGRYQKITRCDYLNRNHVALPHWAEITVRLSDYVGPDGGQDCRVYEREEVEG
jgi:uncharacterized lipoprotein YbaY